MGAEHGDRTAERELSGVRGDDVVGGALVAGDGAAEEGANTSPIKVNAALEGRGGAGVTTHTPTGGILTSAAGGSARRVGAGVAQRGARAPKTRRLASVLSRDAVRERFDANKADAVSTQRPVWLDALFKSERGRALLFSLAESNPNRR